MPLRREQKSKRDRGREHVGQPPKNHPGWGKQCRSCGQWGKPGQASCGRCGGTL